MPVQNSNFKISARPDLATYLLKILIPATINSLVCQKVQFTLQFCPRRWFVRKIFGYYTPEVKIEKIFMEIFCLCVFQIPGLCTPIMLQDPLIKKEQCDEVVGYLSVYRMCFAMACFFALLCIIMLYVKSSKDPRAGIQNG